MGERRGVFAEDFTYRQLDGVIINLDGSDYGIRDTYLHAGRSASGAKSRSNVRITSSYTLGVYRTFIGHPGDLFVLRITTVRKLPTADAFLSTLTVDTASSYRDLISWHDGKLALIGLDDPVITVFFSGEISSASPPQTPDGQSKGLIGYLNNIKSSLA